MQSFLADFFARSGSRVRTVVLGKNGQNFAQKFGGLPPQLRGKQCELCTSTTVRTLHPLRATKWLWLIMMQSRLQSSSLISHLFRTQNFRSHGTSGNSSLEQMRNETRSRQSAEESQKLCILQNPTPSTYLDMVILWAESLPRAEVWGSQSCGPYGLVRCPMAVQLLGR